jgi:hypothetical protein
MRHELIKKLEGIQVAEGLSDRRFAPSLGISNGLWSGVKAGDRVLGRRSLLLIEQRYPGLKQLVDDYWLKSLRTERDAATA